MFNPLPPRPRRTIISFKLWWNSNHLLLTPCCWVEEVWTTAFINPTHLDPSRPLLTISACICEPNPSIRLERTNKMFFSCWVTENTCLWYLFRSCLLCFVLLHLYSCKYHVLSIQIKSHFPKRILFFCIALKAAQRSGRGKKIWVRPLKSVRHCPIWFRWHQSYWSRVHPQVIESSPSWLSLLLSFSRLFFPFSTLLDLSVQPICTASSTTRISGTRRFLETPCFESSRKLGSQPSVFFHHQPTAYHSLSSRHLKIHTAHTQHTFEDHPFSLFP